MHLVGGIGILCSGGTRKAWGEGVYLEVPRTSTEHLCTVLVPPPRIASLGDVVSIMPSTKVAKRYGINNLHLQSAEDVNMVCVVLSPPIVVADWCTLAVWLLRPEAI